jgi:hypothetical protein
MTPINRSVIGPVQDLPRATVHIFPSTNLQSGLLNEPAIRCLTPMRCELRCGRAIRMERRRARVRVSIILLAAGRTSFSQPVGTPMPRSASQQHRPIHRSGESNSRIRLRTQSTSRCEKSHSPASTFALTPFSAKVDAMPRDRPAVRIFRETYADSGAARSLE